MNTKLVVPGLNDIISIVKPKVGRALDRLRARRCGFRRGSALLRSIHFGVCLKLQCFPSFIFALTLIYR